MNKINPELPDNVKKELLVLNTPEFFLQLLCTCWYFVGEGFCGVENLLFERISDLYDKDVFENCDFDRICDEFYQKLQDGE